MRARSFQHLDSSICVAFVDLGVKVLASSELSETIYHDS